MSDYQWKIIKEDLVVDFLVMLAVVFWETLLAKLLFAKPALFWVFAADACSRGAGGASEDKIVAPFEITDITP